MSDRHRLTELLAEPDASLDRPSAVVATIDAGAPTEDEIVRQLDQMAAALDGPATADGVMHHVFVTLGFAGNTTAYYDPNNSLIHRVLERRLGIPISLAIVAIEVARRRNVRLTPVGMPAHFLVGDGSQQRWFDPFAAGRELDVDDCRNIFDQFVPNGRFETAMLAPIGATEVMARVLQNLRVAYIRRGDLARLADVLRLRTALPTAGAGDHLQLARALAALGRYDLAADQYDRLAELLPEDAERHRIVAARHRAHRN